MRSKWVTRCVLFMLFQFTKLTECHSQNNDRIFSIRLRDSVSVTIDRPEKLRKGVETIIIFFALPNGNTTEQTMGKKMEEGDDWHFDIQHIRAQTKFIRHTWEQVNIIVAYLENDYKSWPSWKQRHPHYTRLIPQIIDTVIQLFPARRKSVYLNGHSGGGSFIFGYLSAFKEIPTFIRRISFLDSDYGYDSSYYPKFRNWLKNVKGAALNVFAYNDSVALYNGKLLVSAKGGTWYRSHLFLRHLESDFNINRERDDSLVIYKNDDRRIQFFFRHNPKRRIYHTQQVELNGFIHSVFAGTRFDSKNYTYFGSRAYTDLIEISPFIKHR
jgi:hypothetical protein